MANSSPPSLNLNPLQVGHWPTRVLGLVGTIAFTISAVISFNVGELTPTIIFSALAVYSLFMFLSFGSTSMDSLRIQHRSSFGFFEIQWNEVEAIETDTLGNAVVFKGVGKQLVLPGFIFWAGKDRLEMIRLFQRVVKERRIPLQVAPLAMFAVSRNTRVE
jgi:hypothetical protein